MDTSRLLPPGRETPDLEDVARLPATALLLACLAPRFKRLTGWLGFAPCPGGMGAWTCRLDTRPGVFGCLREACWKERDRLVARFGLYYFPTADEPLFECFSLAAELAVVEPAYGENVRKFSIFPEMLELFRVGHATLSLVGEKRALTLRLDALERDHIISQAGIRAQDAWVVPPGAMEQDLPAWELARDLFRSMAAALTFGLACPPGLWVRSSVPGASRMRLPDGVLIVAPSCGDVFRAECLGWGETEQVGKEALGFPWATDWRVWRGGGDVPAGANGDPCWYAHDLETRAISGNGAKPLDQRPALVILTGFLGAGKTSMLLEMLEYHRAHERFVAVIQNELGATGVDGYLVDGGDSALTLDEGCVCCTLAGSLASGIKRLTEQFHPERIFLETSGLANPLNLLAEQEAWSPLARLEMVVTVVDAVHGLDGLASSDIARDQARGGDVLIVNKCDLADTATLVALRCRLRELNPRAPLLETSHGQIHPGLLFDEGVAGMSRSEKPRPQLPLLRRRNHTDEAFNSVRLMQPAGLTLAALRHRIECIPDGVFRMKGVLCLADSKEPQLLQGVGRRWEIQPLGRPFSDEPFIILIGRNLETMDINIFGCEDNNAKLK